MHFSNSLTKLQVQLLYFADFYFISSCPYFLLFLGTLIASEDSITFDFSPVEEGLVQLLRLGLGFDSRLSTFWAYWRHSVFGLCESSRFESVLLFCLSSYMMATLPGTVPRMVRPAPGQNYPRTGFPLEGRKNENMCLMFLLVLWQNSSVLHSVSL